MSEPTASEPDAANNNAAVDQGVSPPRAGDQGAGVETSDAPPPVDASLERIAELEAELAEMRERWIRAEAENSNVRNRARKDVDETRQYAVQKFATDVVEAAENLKRGIDSLPAPTADEPVIVGKVREGLEGVERSFIGTLERNGIKREDPVGRPFDPNLHQAMAEQESESHAPGTVIQAWSNSWTLNGRLLRPAMVVVAKSPAPELATPAKG